LKILHLSHGTLPDWRIEKCALSASRKLGHESIFAGSPQVMMYRSKAFTKIYPIGWTEGTKFGLPFYWTATKRQICNVLRESKPDIVHAHNIIAAKMISEFEIPFIFDDHEYTSVYVKGIAEPVKVHSSTRMLSKTNSHLINRQIRKIIWDTLLRHRAIGLWTRWEKELLSMSIPTIVTTAEVAEDMRRKYSSSTVDRIFVVPNLPMESETQSLMEPKYYGRLSSTYAGADWLYSNLRAHRNLEGLIDIFLKYNAGDLVMIGVDPDSIPPSSRIRYLEFLPRQLMYNEMSKHSIGLMAFKKHWSHKFKSPNKAYEYAHAGLFVMCTSSFHSVIESFKGNCCIFDEYDDLASYLVYYRDNMEELHEKRLKSFEFAKRNLTWEKFEENLFRAYQTA
jgi:glycosyltransferase involved in cell wall biosynthesis